MAHVRRNVLGAKLEAMPSTKHKTTFVFLFHQLRASHLMFSPLWLTRFSAPPTD